MINSREASLQQVIQSGMTTVLGLLKSGKLKLRRTSDRGDLIKLLGRWYEKFDLVTRKFFSTELRNPWGTKKHFVTDRYQFSRRGKTSTIRHWERWNRIGIVGRIKIIRESCEWSSAKKTNNFQCYRRWRRTFYDLVNVNGCNNGISGIHGKEISKQLSFHCEYDRSHT